MMYDDESFEVDDSLAEQDDTIWKQHKNESNEAYEFFYRYYLPLPASRQTPLVAYREFCIATKAMSRVQAEAITIVPMQYLYWVDGKTDEGDPIEGLDTFMERAAAYNRMMQEDDLERQMEQRRHIYGVETSHAALMVNDWMRMYTQAEHFFVAEMEQADANGIAYNPANEFALKREMWRARRELSEFQRTGANMPAKITNDIIEETYFAQRDNEIVVEFEDPETPNFRHADDFLSVEELEGRLFDEEVQQYLDDIGFEVMVDEED